MRFIFIGVLLISNLSIFAQSNDTYVGGSRWGIKVGPTMATQRWGAWNTQPLFRYNGSVFWESIGTESGAVYAQWGYHSRGSAIRVAPYQDPFTGTLRRGFTTPYVFRNVGMTLGAKKRNEYREGMKYYYTFGMRGEFTVNTNLVKIDPTDPTQSLVGLYEPVDNNVRRLNWGMDIGFGVEKTISELITGIAEITISPDISRQYRQYPIPNVRDPFSGAITTIPGQEIRNLSIELSVGIRFWRKVIYE